MSEQTLPIVADAQTPNSVVLPVAAAGDAVRLNNWRGYQPQITVNRKRVGNRGGAKLTFSDGTTAKIKIKALVPGAPRVYLDGVEIFTTPQPPVWLVVLAATPALSLVLLQGIFGMAIAFGGVIAAVAVVTRTQLSTGVRAAVVAGIALATLGLAFVLAS